MPLVKQLCFLARKDFNVKTGQKLFRGSSKLDEISQRPRVASAFGILLLHSFADAKNDADFSRAPSVLRATLCNEADGSLRACVCSLYFDCGFRCQRFGAAVQQEIQQLAFQSLPELAGLCVETEGNTFARRTDVASVIAAPAPLHSQILTFLHGGVLMSKGCFKGFFREEITLARFYDPEDARDADNTAYQGQILLRLRSQVLRFPENLRLHPSHQEPAHSPGC